MIWLLLIFIGILFIALIPPSGRFGPVGGRHNLPRFYNPNKVIGEPIWNECKVHNKFYDKVTGEEVKVVSMTFDEFMEKHKLPCCKKDK